MATKFTPEQLAAIEARGKVIVSASAGSGKTSVMIEKICRYLISGGDLDNVLAVTFTKKAAGQIKEKLRSALIKKLADCDEQTRLHLKKQLTKISSADISTIHSFCARLLRSYFYVLGIDRSFDIIAADDAVAATYKDRAADSLFDRLYSESDADFLLVLSCLRRNRSDDSVRRLIFEAHSAICNVVDYADKINGMVSLYTREGFEKVCAEYAAAIAEKCGALLRSLEDFRQSYAIPEGCEKLNAIMDEMRVSLSSAAEVPLFSPLPPLSSTRRPAAKEHTREALEEFSAFRDKIKKKYDDLKKDLSDEQTEYDRFINSGALAQAFGRLVLQFDAEYAAVKRDEGKLDYNDLEHFTLRLLKTDDVREQVNAKYKSVYVDEYQDVNPVQERILSLAGAGDNFTVGDVKQAIYGFRGSKSVFFSRKYESMLSTDGSKRLSVNFRSSEAVINFVNKLFSDVMTPSSCGFSYSKEGKMNAGGRYPEGSGFAEFVVFGEDESERERAEGVYSVAAHVSEEVGHSRESRAVLDIVKSELSSKHYSVEEGCMVDTQPGDICILTRKRADASAQSIVRALTDAGYSVESSGEGNICNRSEIRGLLDILSLIDNCQQDIPLATAMLSPIGGLTHDELAAVRIAAGSGASKLPFRACLVEYRMRRQDELAHKIGAFFAKINRYRKLSDILGAARLIDAIISDCGLAARYASGGGAALAAVRRLQREAYSTSGELRLNAFLQKIRAGGYNISAPSASSSDSIKVMTMHSSKGLEFPVVIIADTAASFVGKDYSDMPFDDDYGFAPKFYDVAKKLSAQTVLRKLCVLRRKRENIKNELNLFYVACTRAMCNLHVLCSTPKDYDYTALYDADCYAKLFDVRAYSPRFAEVSSDFSSSLPEQKIVAAADEKLVSEMNALFNASYAFGDSISLPVKSSASGLLNMEEEAFAHNILFDDVDESDEKGGADTGTAYHKFLELCDFSLRDEQSVADEIKSFVERGQMTEEQAQLLNVSRLKEILSMSVFSRMEGARLFREREFLCRLPANQFLPTSAADDVLVQGAIDLLVVRGEDVSVIDYKYSVLGDGDLVKKYTPQLELYKKVVARILGREESSVSTAIINIRRCREIKL